MVREAGLFIFVEVADLGLVLQWDHGTRVYLRLDPKWKGRVSSFFVYFGRNGIEEYSAKGARLMRQLQRQCLG